MNIGFLCLISSIFIIFFLKNRSVKNKVTGSSRCLPYDKPKQLQTMKMNKTIKYAIISCSMVTTAFMAPVQASEYPIRLGHPITVKTPDGKITQTYNVPQIPGYKIKEVHTGRPDNGGEWGRHIEYELIPEEQRMIDGTIGAAGSIVEDFANGRTKDGVIKTVLVGIIWLLKDCFK